MDISTIARALDGERTGRFTANVPGPNHSRSDRSLSITIRQGRICVYSHAGDDWKECRDHVLRRLGIGTFGSRDRRKVVLTAASSKSEVDEKKWSKAKALEIWDDGDDPRGTLVEQYLHQHRGLDLAAELAGPVIRFHRSLWFNKETRLPGMVCLFRSITSDEPCGIHRTFLDPASAQKIDRRMFGIAKGAAIKLDPKSDTEGLICGEGIESCLTAREGGLGRVWALGSSGAVGKFPVLAMPAISLLQENDEASRRDTSKCARRYLRAGKPVTIVKTCIGSDLNDAWRAGRQTG